MTNRSDKPRPWSPEEDETLRKLYSTLSASAIAPQMNRTRAAIKNRINKLRLIKGHNDGCKGMVPWNKGIHYQAGGRAGETQFKPGVRQGVAAKLYKPIGTERISKDGYLERKVNDDMPPQRRWRAVHIVLWEAENGPLPDGHALIFKDGNKQHIALDNLQLISRADLMRRNSVHNYGPEIAAIHQLQGAIQRQINKRMGKSA